jgi:alanine racemase
MTRFDPDVEVEKADSVLYIDLNALKSNYILLRDLAAPAECAACVKADAYGLGVDQVAPALADAGCTTFFVAQAAEGAALRGLLNDVRIFVLHGVWAGNEQVLDQSRLTPVLNSLVQIKAWAAYAQSQNRTLEAAIHIDSGMTRLGLDAEDLDTLATEPSLLDGLSIIHVMSHLSCGDAPDDPMNRAQLEQFNHLRAALPAAPASLAASAGIFLGSDYRFDLVRAGIALYGGQPSTRGDKPMAEVVRATARILQLRDVDSPRAVGYGAAHKVTEPSRIATVSVGYADGYARNLGGRGRAYIEGIAAPVVGRVSMDLVTLDVSDVPREKAVEGCFVDIIGGGGALDDVASEASTISYEILTRLGRRYRRVYTGQRA